MELWITWSEYTYISYLCGCNDMHVYIHSHQTMHTSTSMNESIILFSHVSITMIFTNQTTLSHRYSRSVIFRGIFIFTNLSSGLY